MHRYYRSIIIFLFVLLLCPSVFSTAWTIMIYIGADNDLCAYVNQDIDEMESIGSTANMNIIVQIDGKNSGTDYGYDDYLGTRWATVRRYRIQVGNTTNRRIDAGFISDLGELNSESPTVLRDFIYWAKDNYPADRYMLVLWNHGGGWARPSPDYAITKAIIWDDTNGDGSGIGFSNGEYASVLSQARAYMGKGFSIVAFDACIVGLLEAEYETMGYGDYLVHSEANVPGNGFNYTFLQFIASNPETSEEAIITRIVDTYYNTYSSSITLSGLRLDHDHNNFQNAVNEFARQLILAGGKSNSSISSAMSSALNFGSSLVDIYDFANQIDTRNIGGAGSALDLSAQALKNALGYVPPQVGKPLVAFRQRSYSLARGVMAYTPTGTASSAWSNLDIAECNIWKEFIEGSTTLPSVKLSYKGNSIGKYIQKGTPTALCIDAYNLGSGTASSVTATLTSYDPSVTITGGPVNFGNIAGGEIKRSTNCFTVTVPASLPDSTFVPFLLTFSTAKTAKFVLTALGVVNYPPNQVLLSSPFDFHRSNVRNPQFNWIVPTDPDGDPLHFDVQWDDDPNFGSPITISSNTSSVGFGPSVPRASGSGNCYYTVGSQGEGLMANGATYWWRVRAKDSYSIGNWSSPRSITVNTALSVFDWHQTTDAQFFCDQITDLGISFDKVSMLESTTLILDNMEYATEADAWAIWETYLGGTNVEVNLENRRSVSGAYSLRLRDRNSSYYGGAWRTFTPITSRGVVSVWAKIYSPSLGDKMEFIGLHNGTTYTATFTTGLMIYAKAETLKYYDGTARTVHLAMDSLWHFYELQFDLTAGTSALYIDGVLRGNYTTGGLTQLNMLAVGTKLLGNSAQGTAYWDDFLVSTVNNADSGVIIGTAVAFAWRPAGRTSWGWARWRQNAGDSIKIIVQRKTGGIWTNFTTSRTTGTNGTIDISGLGTADSVRLVGILYRRPSSPLPSLFDWTLDWNPGALSFDENVELPQDLVVYPNYPNPFNPTTVISYSISKSASVKIEIFDISGRLVFEESSTKPAGFNRTLFDGGSLPSGTYFCRITSENESVGRKLLLLK